MIRKLSKIVVMLISPINAKKTGTIDIDVKGHKEYYGPLLVGSNY